MTDLFASQTILIALVAVAFLPNEIWRWAGLIASGGLAEDSEILIWVRYVAAAIVAALCARLLFDPPGALASIPLATRATATAFGVVVLLLVRRNLLTGMTAGIGLFVTLNHFGVFN